MENKRERILQEATELFAEKGIKETSLGEIAQRSGVAKGTLYYYYPSKELLALDVFERITTSHFYGMQALPGDKDLGSLLRPVLKLTVSSPEFTRVFFYLLQEAMCKPAFNERFKTIMRLQRSWWQGVLESQGSPDPTGEALVLSTVLIGCALTWLVDPEVVDPTRVNETVTKLFKKG